MLSRSAIATFAPMVFVLMTLAATAAIAGADAAKTPSAQTPAMIAAAGTASLTVTQSGKFCVNAMIDGKGPYSLMLDTGSEVMALKSDVAKTAGLSVQTGTVEVKGTTGGFVPVGQADLDTVQIAGITLSHPVCVVESLDLPCDGLIGAPLLNAGVVQVDFAGKQLTTFASDAFTPNVGDSAIPITFGRRRVPVVPATIGGIDAKLEIDCGSAFPAELMPDFIKDHDLTEKFTKIGSVGRVSISGPAQSDVYDLQSLILGDKAGISFTGPVPTLFVEPSQSPVASDFDGRVGCPMLARTAITFDYPHAMLYIGANTPPAPPPATSAPVPLPAAPAPPGPPATGPPATPPMGA